MRRPTRIATRTGVLAAVATFVAAGVVTASTPPSDPPVASTAPADSAPVGSTADPAACAEGLTLNDGVLTVATGDPGYYPYIIDDDPTSGEGFEAAITYAVAEQLGFDADTVEWVRTGFDAAIAPGPKDFDFNVQQFSINPDREEVVTFSTPYYTSNPAMVAEADTPAAEATTLEDIQGLRLGVATGTTTLQFVEDVIGPTEPVQIFNDNASLVQAMSTKQIDAMMVDLPTGLYLAGVEMDNGVVVGQFLPTGGEAEGEPWGLLFEQDNPLAECVDDALAILTESGELEAITTEWMSTSVDVPVIDLG